ncbi:MAG: IclR family transcriptional regulator [Trueperaceae bacterium]|nr:IclR family transcriptional regulator [Trueperaceae bacterium]
MDKALSLLEFVANGAQTLNDLSAASQLPKSTVHRLAGVLVDHGFLRTADFRYFLGYRLMELGERARQQVPLSGLARRHMEAIASRTSETIHLGELTGREIVYLEKVEGARGLQMRSRVGLMSPAAATAMGKAMIAFLPETAWGGYFADEPPRTPSSITTVDTFVEELRAVREQGFAFDREENEVGICCVAAPIWDASGQVVAAVSLSGAVIYIPPDRLATLAHDVVACAVAISQELGGGVRS